MNRELVEMEVWNRVLVNQHLIMETLSISCQSHRRGDLTEAMNRTNKILENIRDDSPKPQDTK